VRSTLRVGEADIQSSRPQRIRGRSASRSIRPARPGSNRSSSQSIRRSAKAPMQLKS
jgi:hypothetical protein